MLHGAKWRIYQHDVATSGRVLCCRAKQGYMDACVSFEHIFTFIPVFPAYPGTLQTGPHLACTPSRPQLSHALSRSSGAPQRHILLTIPPAAAVVLPTQAPAAAGDAAAAAHPPGCPGSALLGAHHPHTGGGHSLRPDRGGYSSRHLCTASQALLRHSPSPAHCGLGITPPPSPPHPPPRSAQDTQAAAQAPS